MTYKEQLFPLLQNDIKVQSFYSIAQQLVTCVSVFLSLGEKDT